MKEVSVGERKILLARVGDRFHAVSATCPHYGAPLVEDGGVVVDSRLRAADGLDLPDKTATPRITRSFNFDRSNGNWTINGRSLDPECQEVRLRVQKNSVEHWVVNNSSGRWQHPAHIHFGEFQFLSINGSPPASTGLVQNGRKDVIRLEHNMQTKTSFRFRDFEGKYPFHCHNVVHEDHAMMLIWEIVPGDGDNKTNP